MKYADVQVGNTIKLGRFLTPENKGISNKSGTVLFKCSGGHIKVVVEGIEHTVHLHNIKN